MGDGEPTCGYVYDRASMRAAAERLRSALPAGALLCYAAKANSHPAVVRTFAELVDGIEVASGGELALALDAGTRLTVFGGPAKTDDELAAAVAAGSIINVESVHEIHRLVAVAKRVAPGLTAAGADRAVPARVAVPALAAGEVPVALRVNRAGGARLTATRRMTGLPTPFGLDEAELAAAVAAVAAPLRVVGPHLHAVSNNLDAAAHGRFVVDAVGWSVSTARRLGFDLSLINLGGGFGVDYAGGARFDLDAFAAGLREAAARTPGGVRLMFESGRLLAAGCGWYAAQVLDVKRVHGRWFAVLRGGTHHFRLPAAWGYSHPFTVLPVESWRYPFPRPEVRDAPVDVVGELCTPTDVLCRERPVERLRAGDVVVFGDAGAYGLDISHRDFLRHPHPRIIVI